MEPIPCSRGDGAGLDVVEVESHGDDGKAEKGNSARVRTGSRMNQRGNSEQAGSDKIFGRATLNAEKRVC
jgi:hypothetical protein